MGQVAQTMHNDALEVSEKPTVPAQEEATTQGRFYTPPADIFETGDALIVVMEMPGVSKDALTVSLERHQLEVDGRISLDAYSNLKPIYTEYGVGHFRRRFRVSNDIDANGIEARLEDGVLTITMPKLLEAAARTIEIN